MVIKNAKVYMYADDACISFQTDCISKLNDGLNKDLEALDTWLNGNKPSLKVTKISTLVSLTLISSTAVPCVGCVWCNRNVPATETSKLSSQNHRRQQL